MQRRSFMQAMVMTTAAGALAAGASGANQEAPAQPDREYWSELLFAIAKPVLSLISAGKLQKTMPVELSPVWDGRDRRVAYMECFGRLMSGLAPWLTLPDDETKEGRQRKRLREWAIEGYGRSVDPTSPDYLLWRKEGQPLVDSAYFSNALIRAPQQLWAPLDRKTKARIVEELKLLRRVSAPYTNWLLFAALNEAFLLSVGERFDPIRINLAIKKINEWYVGDGWYADGMQFHYDYYNSFVIHPMLLEILEVLVKTGTTLGDRPSGELHDRALKRAQRYAEHLERMISPDGAFPPIGRSATYRTAAFQPLALLSWRKSLPEAMSEGRVRSAMTAVHRKIFTNPTNFTADGFLTLGFADHQPELADIYSNNGSMYITTESFLPLALPPGDTFWTSPAEDWTMKKAFSNRKFKKDYPVDY